MQHRNVTAAKSEGFTVGSYHKPSEAGIQSNEHA